MTASPRLPLSPPTLRALTGGVVTLAAATALMVAAAWWHLPRTGRGSVERWTCVILLDTATWTAWLAAAGGMVVQAGRLARAESKPLWAVIAGCLLYGLFFGVAIQ